MKRLLKIEKFLFYFLVLAFFWQLRLVWQAAGGAFNEWTSVYFYATDLIVVAVLFLWLVRIWREKLKPDFGRTEMALGAFLAIAGLSIVAADNRLLAGYGFIKLLEMAAIFLYVKNNFSKIFNRRIFWPVFIFGALAQSLAAIIQFFTQKSLGLKFFAESPLAPNLAGVAKIVVDGEKIIRAYGLVPHPNLLAAILIVAIFGTAWLFMNNKSVIPAKAGIQDFGFHIKRAGTILLLLAFLVIIVALFFTFSRGVIIVGYAFLILWLAYLWFFKIADRKKIISVIALLLIVNGLLLIVYWPYAASRYDIGALAGSQSVDLRAAYNGVAFDMIKRAPLLGVGQSNFVLVFGQYYDKLQAWIFQPVHNVYLLITAETGILGLLAFLIFLALAIKDVWGQRKDLSVSVLLFIVYCLLFIGLFDHFWWDLQQGQIMFWLLLGLLAA